MGVFPRAMLDHQRSGDLAEEESWLICPVLRRPSLCLLTSLGSLTWFPASLEVWSPELVLLNCSVKSQGQGGQAPGHWGLGGDLIAPYTSHCLTCHLSSISPPLLPPTPPSPLTSANLFPLVLEAWGFSRCYSWSLWSLLCWPSPRRQLDGVVTWLSAVARFQALVPLNLCLNDKSTPRSPHPPVVLPRSHRLKGYRRFFCGGLSFYSTSIKILVCWSHFRCVCPDWKWHILFHFLMKEISFSNFVILRSLRT